MAQTVSFTTPFNANPAVSNFLILGQHNEQLYVLSHSFGVAPQLLVYDNNMQLISNAERPELKNSVILAFVPGKDGVDLLIENSADGNRNYKSVRISDKSETEKEILSLPLEYANDWDFAVSPGNKYFVLYKLSDIQKDSLKMNIIVMNNEYEVVDGKKFSFFVEGAFERLGNIFIDDAGSVYFIVHDQPLNYKLGTRMKLYKYLSTKGILVKKEHYLKEKKPVDVVLSFHPEKELVYLHSFYSNFYTQDVSGILSAALNDKLELVVPFSYYEFDKKFKKDLNTYSSGISSSDLMNFLRISNASVSDSGTAYVTATLEPSFANPILSYAAKRPAKKEERIMDDDPLLAIGQREYLIRREMGMSGAIRGRRFSGSGGGPSTGYAEAYTNVMNQRPDLFFMSQDTTQKKNNSQTLLPVTKVQDRQIVFAFDKNAGMKWHKSFVLENQNQGKSPALPPAETDNSIINLHYRLNKKERTELGFTRIVKADGNMQDLPLVLPQNISLLTNGPICKLSSNSVAVLYFATNLNKVGLAKIEW